MRFKRTGLTVISLLLIVAGLIFTFLFVGAVVAKSTEVVYPPGASWFEHVDLMNILIGILFVLVAWFIVRLIKKYDRNQDVMFEKLDNLCLDFYTLRGECDGIRDNGGCAGDRRRKKRRKANGISHTGGNSNG